jgi:hypothetical protein
MSSSHGRKNEILIVNQRIQNLIRLADVHILPDDSEYGHCIIGLEKFAELLIRECADVIDSLPYASQYFPHVADLVKERFGVNDE